MNQEYLLDENLYKVIESCFINKKHPNISEVFVIYADNVRETIWSFNPMRYDFTHQEFIGKTKIEAIFHCDRKSPRSAQVF